MQNDQLLTREQLRALYIRNCEKPELGVPVYEPWTDNKRKQLSSDDLRKSIRRAGEDPDAPPPDLRTWTRRLHSKNWRVQYTGKKDVTQVMRQVRTTAGWREVPLNDRKL